MRRTFRNTNVRDYWEKRWNNIKSDEEMANENVYPLKYSQQIIKDPNAKILEAGCGAGRILRYYHNKGYNIMGIDYIDSAIKKLQATDNTLNVRQEDITNLSFSDSQFKYVLAFGLYHGIDTGLESAIKETFRVMENNGILCASFRADNIQNKINDFLYDYKNKKITSKENDALQFHKLNLNKKELSKLFMDAGFDIISISPVVNMPILYKFKFFRSKKHKIFNESLGRNDGYNLSLIGEILHSFLFFFFPNQFCNLYLINLKK